MEIVDMAGNRLILEKQPLERLRPQIGDAESQEEKGTVWIEDF